MYFLYIRYYYVLCPQTVSVKEGEGEDLLSSYAGDMDPSLRRKRYMAISKQLFYV